MPTRDFDAARAERLRERDPIRFTLGGETFTCVPAVPIGASFDLADAPEPDRVTDLSVSRSLAAFIENTLVDGDVDRFRAALRSKAEPVNGADLYEVVTWLAGEYAARPTSPSTGSSGGRATTGETSSSEPDATALETSAA